MSKTMPWRAGAFSVAGWPRGAKRRAGFEVDAILAVESGRSLLRMKKGLPGASTKRSARAYIAFFGRAGEVRHCVSDSVVVSTLRMEEFVGSLRMVLCCDDGPGFAYSKVRTIW
jgi:hypothetical protein